MSKEDLLKNSDIISIHLVLGERYKNLITKKELSIMKNTAFLINTSRGPIINENDLVEALKDETIAGVGLDVYNMEPLPQDHKLRFCLMLCYCHISVTSQLKITQNFIFK